MTARTVHFVTFYKIMKRLTITIILCLLMALTGCGVEDNSATSVSDEPEMTREAGADEGTWCLALYLCGSNLESRQGWATKTIKEITGTDIPDNVTVVIETGGSKKWRNDTVKSEELGRYVVSHGALEVVESKPPTSMGESQTLSDFLTFCQTNYPADHTAVVLWDHGGGPMVGACYDENQGFDALSLSELDEAFGVGVEARGGDLYDIVGFDACLMGSLETAAMLSDAADYMVASQEIEPGAGWDYRVPIEAMGANRSADQVASIICDGYMSKSEERKKGTAATLSAINLSKINDIRDAILSALDSLHEAEGNEVGALRRLAYGSRSAEGFGGATDEEGMSNLIDLKGLADALSTDEKLNGTGWKRVADAVDAAVINNVNGAAVSGAHGLSIWYPRAFLHSDLSNYVSISPLSGYAGVLNDYFSASLGQIAFSDSGSIGEDGFLSITIAPEAHSSFYNVYVVNRRVDGDYMDKNIDIYDDWDTLTFRYNPADAVRITIDDMTLDAQVIDYDEDRMVFSCPVMVNAERKNLRIAWIWDTYEEGHYELLGAWSGVDETTGLADRMDEDIKPGDEIGAVSLSTGDVRDSIILSGEPVIDEAPMEPGSYECYFVAQDLHGKEYVSDTISYKVTEGGDTVL